MKKLILCVLVLGLIGCANPQAAKDSKIANEEGYVFSNCLQTAAVGVKAQCAYQYYSKIITMSDSDYGKLPLLNLVTKFYVVLKKVDRRQISEDDFKFEFMKASNEYSIDLNAAQRQSIANNRAAAMQQQQLFLNAQRLLSPPNSTINCYHIPGSPVTTCQ